MNKKLWSILGASALAAMLMIGCGTDQEPPPEDDTLIEEDLDLNEEVDDFGDQELNEDTNVEDGMDLDPAQDKNTPEEEILEDPKDMEDEDRKDE
ncbi:hypothetical protein [Bacillus sp. 2205SS5-2]|uniref:hypothetical protein n=1 Tax=Bacillus sp. 2205SS5-2 TaxID=3109031 RepID=UPI003004C4AD